MAGGLMQLVAYGAQDIYLTGNPQITFFKVVYRRHTNFAVESIEQTFNGAADIGRRFTCTIARNGDLLHRLYLQVDVSSSGGNSLGNAYLGFQLLDYVEVEIGGQVIDKQYGEWMAVWCDLTHTLDQSVMLSQMLDGVDTNATLLDRLHIPLQFWFCRNPGLALPLIALQYHEVKINVQFSNSNPTVIGTVGSGSFLSNTSIWADYIFLDTDERRRFAQVSHEYLIEQVQYSNALTVATGATTTQHELRFNHPVKELVWLVDASASSTAPHFNGYYQCSTALLQLNGQDRFKRRSGDYFTKVQRYEHHTGAGRAFITNALTVNTTGNPDFVGSNILSATHIYSFALKPEEHQPSGTCNFSRIDNAVLNLEFLSASTSSGVPAVPAGGIPSGTVLKVYAVNYNVLRIMSGMGGLAYSN
jgi:hypothetical protein